MYPYKDEKVQLVSVIQQPSSILHQRLEYTNAQVRERIRRYIKITILFYLSLRVCTDVLATFDKSISLHKC